MACILPRLHDPPNFPYACNGLRCQSAQYASRLSKYCYLLHLAGRTCTWPTDRRTRRNSLERIATTGACRSSPVTHRRSIVQINNPAISYDTHEPEPEGRSELDDELQLKFSQTENDQHSHSGTQQRAFAWNAVVIMMARSVCIFRGFLTRPRDRQFHLRRRLS